MFEGLGTQARRLVAGETTSVELTRAALDRAEAAQPTLNAFRRLRRDAALVEAKSADERLAAGERRSLLGVPVAIKDDMDLAGEPTAFGCAGDYPSVAEDGVLVRQLRAAGAVIIGKTNTPEVGLWPVTEGAAFGVTRNPWHLDHTPGGSSGGSAAAVAAGIVEAAVGSDGAGSIRIPAAWSHLVGVKPGRGTLPTPEAFNGITEWGPLTRTTADAALLLDVLAGESRFQAAALREPGRSRVGLSIRPAFMGGLRIRLDPRVRAAVGVARRLHALGHEIVVADHACSANTPQWARYQQTVTVSSAPGEVATAGPQPERAKRWSHDRLGELATQSLSSMVQHLGPPPDFRSSAMSTKVGS